MYNIEHLHDLVHHQTSRTTFPTLEEAREALLKIRVRCVRLGYKVYHKTPDKFSFFSGDLLHTLRLIEQ